MQVLLGYNAKQTCFSVTSTEFCTTWTGVHLVVPPQTFPTSVMVVVVDIIRTCPEKYKCMCICSQCWCQEMKNIRLFMEPTNHISVHLNQIG